MLKGEKVRLRLLEHSDLRKLAEWRNDPKAQGKFFSPWPVALSEQPRWYERYIGNPMQRMFMIEAIDGKDAKAIGHLALMNIGLQNRNVELGRVLIGEADYRNRGYMIEAIKLILSFAFKELGMNRVYIQTFKGHGDVTKLYEKCGFQAEGTLRQALWRHGGYQDVVVMSVLREEWRGD